MKKFISPEIDILKFTPTDIIATSDLRPDEFPIMPVGGDEFPVTPA